MGTKSVKTQARHDFLFSLCWLTAALTEVMLTGGLPPRIDAACSAEEAYRHLYPRVIAQNHKFYKRFPGDVAKVQRIITCLSDQPDGGLRLANGDHLTPRFVMLLGCNGLFCKTPHPCYFVPPAVTVVVAGCNCCCCCCLLLSVMYCKCASG